MAENLLEWLPHLTKDECNEIVYAVSKFSSKYRTNPPPYNDPASLGLLDRDEVIKALHEVYMVYGTKPAALAHSLVNSKGNQLNSRFQARVRGYRVEAARLTLPFWKIGGLAQV
jgi:hypothetical protein